MRAPAASERDTGQAVVEMAIILSALLILIGGLIDAGRGFYMENSVSSAARFGARWGSVVGGTCAQAIAVSSSDYCNKMTTSNTGFWTLSGNMPLQGFNTACPGFKTLSSAQQNSYYYTASNFQGSGETSIVGAIVARYDTSASSSGSTSPIGLVTPGFDLSLLRVCIAATRDTTSGVTLPTAGDVVDVAVYYPFTPVGPLLGRITLDLSATSQFQVE